MVLGSVLVIVMGVNDTRSVHGHPRFAPSEFCVSCNRWLTSFFPSVAYNNTEPSVDFHQLLRQSHSLELLSISTIQRHSLNLRVFRTITVAPNSLAKFVPLPSVSDHHRRPDPYSNHHSDTNVNMFSKTTLLVAFVAATVQLAAAAPPACLIYAVKYVCLDRTESRSQLRTTH